MAETQTEEERDWMTGYELASFRKQRANGAVSFFRTSICVSCGCEIHKSKTYCSETCKAAFSKGIEEIAETELSAEEE